MERIIIDNFDRCSIVPQETDGKNNVWKLIVGKPIRSYAENPVGDSSSNVGNKLINFKYSGYGIIPFEKSPSSVFSSNIPLSFSLNFFSPSNDFPVSYLIDSSSAVFEVGSDGIGNSLGTTYGFTLQREPDIEYANKVIVVCHNDPTNKRIFKKLKDDTSWSTITYTAVTQPFAIVFWHSLWYILGKQNNVILVFDVYLNNLLTTINLDNSQEFLDLVVINNEFLGLITREREVWLWNGAWFGTSSSVYFYRIRFNYPIVYYANIRGIPFFFLQNQRDLEVYSLRGINIERVDIIRGFTVVRRRDSFRLSKSVGAYYGDTIALWGNYVYSDIQESVYNPSATLFYRPFENQVFILDTSLTPNLGSMLGMFVANNVLNFLSKRQITLFRFGFDGTNYIYERIYMNERMSTSDWGETSPVKQGRFLLLSNWFTLGLSKIKIQEIDIYFEKSGTNSMNILPFSVSIDLIDEFSESEVSNINLTQSDNVVKNFVKRFKNLGLEATKFRIKIDGITDSEIIPVIKRIVVYYDFVS
ncbi:MAG: hypothetical protein ABIK72_07280 [candidate division WOR-3 bacterium]